MPRGRGPAPHGLSIEARQPLGRRSVARVGDRIGLRGPVRLQRSRSPRRQRAVSCSCAWPARASGPAARAFTRSPARIAGASSGSPSWGSPSARDHVAGHLPRLVAAPDLLRPGHRRLVGRQLRRPSPRLAAEAVRNQLVDASDRGRVTARAEVGADPPSVDRRAGGHQPRDPPLVEVAAGHDHRVGESRLVEQRACRAGRGQQVTRVDPHAGERRLRTPAPRRSRAGRPRACRMCPPASRRCRARPP